MPKARHKWEKGIVEFEHEGATCLSVVFTWDAPKALERARDLSEQGRDVRIGGPGVFRVPPEFKRELMAVATVGGEIADTVVRHNPDATFASKGCPVGCSFCVVPALEGRDFTLIWDFEPRPTLCDNNLSALPGAYQDYIVKKYQSSGVVLTDCNSGFEPATFTPEVLERWRKINKGPWRFAYDESIEGPEVKAVADMLKDAGFRNPSRKRVYTLIGNEPFEACMTRIKEVIAWGCEPHVQPMIRLNALKKEPWIRRDLDWCPLCRDGETHDECSTQLLRDVARWTNAWLWRKIPFEDYDRHKRNPK